MTHQTNTDSNDWLDEYWVYCAIHQHPLAREDFYSRADAGLMGQMQRAKQAFLTHISKHYIPKTSFSSSAEDDWLTKLIDLLPDPFPGEAISEEYFTLHEQVGSPFGGQRPTPKHAKEIIKLAIQSKVDEMVRLAMAEFGLEKGVKYDVKKSDRVIVITPDQLSTNKKGGER